jgi:hypothetical protein
MRRSRHPYASPDAALVYSGSSSLILVTMSATKILWGPDRRRLRDCARHDVGGDAMGGVETRLPATTRTAMVRTDLGSSCLSAARVLLVVVCLWRLRT